MLKYYVADAFADNIFEGNPAGVCVMDEWISIVLLLRTGEKKMDLIK